MYPPIGLFFECLGVTAVVEPPDAEAITTSGIWVSPAMEDMPVGADLKRRELRRVLALKRADVPAVPRGTIVTVAEPGQAVATRFRVDGFELFDAEHVRVVLVSDPDAS